MLSAVGSKSPIETSTFYLEYFIDHPMQIQNIFHISKHHLIDTGNNDIIATGDFNLNILTNNTAGKIHLLCSEFALHQSIVEPAHYTATSSFLIDVILVHNQDSLVASGVGDPFLEQELWYHCPIFT